MNYLSFIAAVVGSLAIPITVVIALAIFRKPIAEMVSRVSSYEGMGQKVTFGRKLASAEAAVSVAVEQAREAAVDKAALEGVGTEPTRGPGPDTTKEDRALQQVMSVEPNFKDVDLKSAGLVQLAEIASSNPSFTIIRAFEELRAAINELADTVLPRPAGRDMLSQLANLESGRFVTSSFIDAALNLNDLRDRAAHGQHNPTAGEAVTYVESVRQLVAIASGVTAVNRGRLEALRDAQGALEARLAAVKQELAEMEIAPGTANRKEHLTMMQRDCEQQLDVIRQKLNPRPRQSA